MSSHQKNNLPISSTESKDDDDILNLRQLRTLAKTILTQPPKFEEDSGEKDKDDWYYEYQIEAEFG